MTLRPPSPHKRRPKRLAALTLLGLLGLAGTASSAHASTVPLPVSTSTAAAAQPTAAAAPHQPFRLHSALGAPSQLILRGEHRTRYQHLGNQFRPGLDRADQALALRTLLAVGGTFGPFEILGELQDSRAYLTDENSAVSTAVVNALELLQAYVGLNLEDVFADGDKLTVRAGRQTIDLGNNRLIGRNGFRNTIQAYNGITTRWRSSGGTEVSALGVLPVRPAPTNSEAARLRRNAVELDRENFDQVLWAAHLRQPIAAGVAAEGYIFGLHERDGEDFATRDRQLYTPGLRVVRAPKRGEWDFDVESILQFGSRRSSTSGTDTEDLDVFAHFHQLSAGYTFDVRSALRLAAVFDYASGNSSDTDDRVERFDVLFGPRRGPYGPTDIFGLLAAENLVSPGLRIEAKPHRRVDGFIAWRANWLDESDDSFARSGLRDADGDSGTFAGHQVELRTRVWLIPDNIRWELGGAAFLRGAFMEDAPNATDNGHPLYGYTDIQLYF